MKIAFAIIGEAHAAGSAASSAAAAAASGSAGTEAPATGGTTAPEGTAAPGTHSGTDATHAGTEVAHGEKGGHGGAFPPFDPTFFASQIFWLVLTFGIFYFLMARVAMPRLASIIETRKNRIDQDLDEARRLKDEADHAAAAYELELAEARKRAHAIGQKARDESKAGAESERNRIESELNAKLQAAEERISGIKSRALKEVDGIASQTTAVIVEELLGAKATAAEIASAITGKR
jgi:F-type H+-transporting ATPase subunit b